MLCHVMLCPTVLGHAAITVTFVDVTAVEEAKELVRKRYAWSYNEKESDDKLDELFDSNCWNPAGTLYE